MFAEADLLELLAEQETLLQSLLTDGKSQAAAIAAGRMNELLAILAEKQPKLDRLGQLRACLETCREQINDERFWTSEQTRAACRQHHDTIAIQFQDLLRLEQECEEALGHSRNHIQQRLQELDSGRQAATMYRAQSQTPATPRSGFSAAG